MSRAKELILVACEPLDEDFYDLDDVVGEDEDDEDIYEDEDEFDEDMDEDESDEDDEDVDESNALTRGYKKLVGRKLTNKDHIAALRASASAKLKGMKKKASKYGKTAMKFAKSRKGRMAMGGAAVGVGAGAAYAAYRRRKAAKKAANRGM